jgi:lysozyme family protein
MGIPARALDPRHLNRGFTFRMIDRFNICVAFVLDHETEYNKDGSVKVEHDPRDPGGVTKYGIDQRDHPNVNVPALTKAQAIEIYRNEEWAKCRCANLKQPWDLAVFDTAVNIGVNHAARLLQRSVGAGIDGFVGPVTIAKTNAASVDDLFDFVSLREAYYRSLGPKWQGAFLAGALNRLTDLRKAVQPDKEVIV